MKEKDLQNKTLMSLKKHSQDIYSMDFFANYDLDSLLKTGNRNTLAFILRTRRIFKNKKVMINPFVKPGCSTYYCHNDKNEVIFGRNFDYRNSPCLIVKTSPSKGYKSIGIVDLNFMLFGYKHSIKLDKPQPRLLLAPYGVTDGMNEKGLTISVLELNDKATNQKRGKIPLTTTLAVRAILDRCANVEEAIAFLNDHDMHSVLGFNYHFHISDKETSVIAEYVNNKLELFYKDDKKYVCLTNFYISKNGNNKKTHGYDRYKIMDDFLSSNDGKISDESAMELLNKVKVKYMYTYKHIWKYEIDTCYSALYNLDTLSVMVERNGNAFKFFI